MSYTYGRTLDVTDTGDSISASSQIKNFLVGMERCQNNCNVEDPCPGLGLCVFVVGLA